MHKQPDLLLATLPAGKGPPPYRRYTAEIAFLRDSMFFMQRIRDSYQVILDVEQAQQRAKEIRRNKKRNAIESISAREISTQAFLKGDRARLSQAEWDDFITDTDFEGSILYPIEVVAGEPEPRKILQLTEQKARKSRPVARSRTVEEDEKIGNQTLPERIKIYSAPLMVIMSQMTNDAYWTNYIGSSIMLLRPYQDLFYYESTLRQWLARLEKDFEGFNGSTDIPEASRDIVKDDSNTDGRSPPISGDSAGSLLRPISIPAGQQMAAEAELLGQTNINHENIPREHIDDETSDRQEDDNERNDADSDSDDDDSNAREKELANSITSLIHLRCLIKFIDSELKPRQDYVEGPLCSHISFHDLWHLFKPGTEVIEQGEKQAWVVLRVEIPLHKIEEPWERWNKQVDDDDSEEITTKDQSDFNLHCASIDFDGKNFGPVSKAFIISPFGDLKLVKSLPVYPVRFKGQDTRQNLIRRGRLLLEVADFKAMYYTGPTLDKGDEIDSQVVVDFNEALADEKRSTAWKPTISSVNTAPKDGRDNICNAMCCRFHGKCDGFSTDLKMTTDYIGSLVPDARARSLILSPRSLEDTLDSIEELTETELLIMTYRVFGFVLRSRKWGKSLYYLNSTYSGHLPEFADVFHALSPA